MSKKAMFLWCLIGIGVFVGLYVVVWAQSPMRSGCFFELFLLFLLISGEGFIF